MRPAARRTARRLSGAGLAAALLLPGAAAAQAAPRPQLPAADGKADGKPDAKKGQELPVMPSALDPRAADGACTPASGVKAKTQDWSRQRLDLDRTHRHGAGAGITVALIDTGVAPGAAGLDGRVTAQGAAGEDCVGRGTFLAGLIAGNGGDEPRLAGVAPEARILALRGTDARGEASPELVVAAVREATAARAQVIAVTAAFPQRDAALTRAVEEARRAGAVVVAAATPDVPRNATGEIPSRTYWPAGEPGVLPVADMLPGGTRPEGSVPTEGIALMAPGAGVVSGGPRGDGHYLGGGVPVATAYVAGAAALVRAALPDAPPDAVVRRLTATAYPADVPQLDPYAAVTKALDPAAAAPGPERAAAPLTVRDTSAADRATGRATVFVLLGSAGVLAVLWAGYAFARARARRWRPARAGAAGEV